MRAKNSGVVPLVCAALALTMVIYAIVVTA